MIEKTLRHSLFLLALLALATAADAGGSAVPEPFRGHEPGSKFSISYGDVDAILKYMVVNVGRSSRDVAPPPRAKTGTRMRAKVSRSTLTEGNRFYFEEFKANEDYVKALHNVRLSLEAIPGRMPLEHFNRTEQLAYWLNLYNITMLDLLVGIYPERDLEKELVGRKSFLDDKVLNVAGVALSLNDIQFSILANNYPGDARIMYGLFQGVIGGPNIRKRAYTAENVYRYLEDNAAEFINSNRGTYTRNGPFEVSALYARNRHYFPDFEADLKRHLMGYIEGPERSELRAAKRLDADIEDWTIADVYGTYSQIGGSFSTSQAAMLDAVVSTQPSGSGGTVSTNFSAASSALIAKTEPVGALSQAQLELLTSLKAKEEAANLMREGRVTIEELGEVPVQPSAGDADTGEDQDDRN